ncbi:hypothetical protein HUJ04_004498 [Dendroctonus ponderosae]|nr:hypothetical protein HUJ04_004498 [Dendroctonus ponderosae]
MDEVYGPECTSDICQAKCACLPAAPGSRNRTNRSRNPYWLGGPSINLRGWRVLDKIGCGLSRHWLTSSHRSPLHHRRWSGRQIVDKRAPPLAFDFPKIERVDHQQRFVSDTLRWFRGVRQLSNASRQIPNTRLLVGVGNRFSRHRCSVVYTKQNVHTKPASQEDWSGMTFQTASHLVSAHVATYHALPLSPRI